MPGNHSLQGTGQVARPFTAASFNQYLAEHRLMGSSCPHAIRFICLRAICPRVGMHWVTRIVWPRQAICVRRSMSASAMVAEGRPELRVASSSWRRAL
jgi:hypothetical protein